MSNTRHPMLVLCSQIRSLSNWHGGWGGVIGTAITRTLLVGLMLCVEKRGGAVKAATPPNVVLIVADDQHWGDYGFMGHPHLRTPTLTGSPARVSCFVGATCPVASVARVWPL